MMARDNGRYKSAIWLLGDSPPARHSDNLDDPLDWKHPTRHNIFTPLLGVANRQLYLHDQRFQIDDRYLFVRNAVSRSESWGTPQELDREKEEFRGLVTEHGPFLILSFGEKAFEFARLALGERPKRDGWEVPGLRRELDTRTHSIDPQAVNLLPLLHASIARRHFMYCHRQYEGNYFEYAGRRLAEILIDRIERGEADRFRGLWLQSEGLSPAMS